MELARTALQVARAALPAYSSRFSRKDFTQHQLFALMVLMTDLKTDPRGITAIVADWSDIRAVLGLSHVPHHTTIYKAQQRLLKKTPTIACSTPSSKPPSPAAWSARKKRLRSTARAWRLGIARRTTPGAWTKNATK